MAEEQSLVDHGSDEDHNPETCPNCAKVRERVMAAVKAATGAEKLGDRYIAGDALHVLALATGYVISQVVVNGDIGMALRIVEGFATTAVNKALKQRSDGNKGSALH
jgi:hypothetical protein